MLEEPFHVYLLNCAGTASAYRPTTRALSETLGDRMSLC